MRCLAPALATTLMKHLKSGLRDLRQIFERSLTVRHVAEPFLTFDGPRSAPEIRSFMKGWDFDVVGVRDNGLVVGYVKRSELTNGTLDDHRLRFEPELQVDESTPILAALRLLRNAPRVFVVVMDHVLGIITKGDLQKAPVRMYLFGALSLLEMQLLRLIRTTFINGAWKPLLSRNRIGKANVLFKDRRHRNEAIDLADCLQFSDKATIIAKSEKLRKKLGFNSCRDAQIRLDRLKGLRDALAHSQDIVTGSWPGLLDLLEDTELILERAEKLNLNFKLVSPNRN